MLLYKKPFCWYPYQTLQIHIPLQGVVFIWFAPTMEKEFIQYFYLQRDIHTNHALSHALTGYVYRLTGHEILSTKQIHETLPFNSHFLPSSAIQYENHKNIHTHLWPCPTWFTVLSGLVDLNPSKGLIAQLLQSGSHSWDSSLSSPLCFILTILVSLFYWHLLTLSKIGFPTKTITHLVANAVKAYYEKGLE